MESLLAYGLVGGYSGLCGAHALVFHGLQFLGEDLSCHYSPVSTNIFVFFMVLSDEMFLLVFKLGTLMSYFYACVLVSIHNFSLFCIPIDVCKRG